MLNVKVNINFKESLIELKNFPIKKHKKHYYKIRIKGENLDTIFISKYFAIFSYEGVEKYRFFGTP